MKTAIEYLKTQGIEVTDTGKILSELPNGLEGIFLVGNLEETTINELEEYCYTIIGNQVTKIDI